ncbi:MAG: hypothetical protein HY711_11245 [Candidatus Melainabacteria bacterium]|nr:hypothetical protein [Candidatus Melainabacteria bacterium]
MGINFHITSVREGTIFNVMQFLSLEKVTGILSVSFGRHIPDIAIYFVSGTAATAEFGDMSGDAVLDMILCQEYAIKEVNFAPGRMSRINDKALIVRAASLSGALLQSSKDVDKCQARSLIYGLLPLYFSDSGRTDLLLQVLYDFSKVRDYLLKIPPGPTDKQAPLPQCVLLHRALTQNLISYNTPLVPLKLLRNLLEAVQPLADKEVENLRGYMRSLLPHPRATHMPIDRFYAFATAVESIAHRRGPEVGEQTRTAIYRLIQRVTRPTEAINA